MRERDALDDQLGAIGRIEQELDDQLMLIELGESEKDDKTIAEAEMMLKGLRAELARRELEALLSGEADANDCYLEVHEGAGIKSATVTIKGHNAYGWLKSENGVHRLVRISPFDANARRHTSFASVVVYPVVDDRIKIEINENDVRTDVMRSGGAGGQHVNKTESAVRLTHIPTGIAVKCQTDKSQHRNRAMAWDMLRARLFELEVKKREEKAAADQAAKTDIAWGHQIRSYVLQPYQMVKDLRTGVQTSNTGAVLDGDLDAFMQAALAQKAFGGAPAQVEDVE